LDHGVGINLADVCDAGLSEGFRRAGIGDDRRRGIGHQQLTHRADVEVIHVVVGEQQRVETASLSGTTQRPWIDQHSGAI
jgi:hypothetical protein